MTISEAIIEKGRRIAEFHKAFDEDKNGFGTRVFGVPTEINGVKRQWDEVLIAPRRALLNLGLAQPGACVHSGSDLTQSAVAPFPNRVSLFAPQDPASSQVLWPAATPAVGA